LKAGADNLQEADAAVPTPPAMHPPLNGSVLRNVTYVGRERDNNGPVAHSFHNEGNCDNRRENLAETRSTTMTTTTGTIITIKRGGRRGYYGGEDGRGFC
jgi:hypothetical protein